MPRYEAGLKALRWHPGFSMSKSADCTAAIFGGNDLAPILAEHITGQVTIASSASSDIVAEVPRLPAVMWGRQLAA